MVDRRLLTFPGGLNALRRLGAIRKHPFSEAATALPATDCDFGPFKETLTAAPVDRIDPRDHVHNKSQELAAEFEGQPRLLHLNGLVPL